MSDFCWCFKETQRNREAACGVSQVRRGVGVGRWRDVRRRHRRRLVRVLLKCLTLWSVVAQTAEVQRPGKGEIKGPEVNRRAKSFLSSCEEVKNIS